MHALEKQRQAKPAPIRSREESRPVALPRARKPSSVSSISMLSLLSPENTGSDNVLLDLVSFVDGSTFELDFDEDSFGWLQVLDGAGKLALCQTCCACHTLVAYSGQLKSHREVSHCPFLCCHVCAIIDL